MNATIIEIQEKSCPSRKKLLSFKVTNFGLDQMRTRPNYNTQWFHLKIEKIMTRKWIYCICETD